MVRRASLDNFVHNGIVSRRFEFITLSRRCSYYYLIGVLLKEEIFILTEGRNRRVENLIFDRAGLFERCENLFLRKKVEKRGKEKKLVVRERLHSSSARIKVPSMCGGCTHVDTSLT